MGVVDAPRGRKHGARKVFRCRDIGIDCDHVIEARSEAEMLEKALAHAQDAHAVIGTPHDLIGRIRSAIRDA